MNRTDLSVELARCVVERWRTQGFDAVGVYPSGYCYPIQEASIAKDSPEGYAYHPVASREAADAVAAAIRDGASYSFKELGNVRPVPLATLIALRRVRVLIVDDRPDTRELVTVILETCGAADVTAVASSQAALAALECERFDVLVADIMMPGEDGYALIRKVRALAPEQGANIPAVALTALGSEDDRAAALAAGFQVHLAKPVEAATLCDAVATLARRE
jgi:CheY-like chemotaxis protein